MKRGRGRPAKPDRELRDHDIRIPVTNDDAMRAHTWAEKRGEPLASLLRGMLRRAMLRDGVR